MSLYNTEKGYDYYQDSCKGHVKEGKYIGLIAVLDVMKDMVTTEVPHKENTEKLETIYNKFKLEEI